MDKRCYNREDRLLIAVVSSMSSGGDLHHTFLEIFAAARKLLLFKYLFCSWQGSWRPFSSSSTKDGTYKIVQSCSTWLCTSVLPHVNPIIFKKKMMRTGYHARM